MRDYMEQPFSPFSAPPPQGYDLQNPKHYHQNGYFGHNRSQFDQFARQWHKLRRQNSRRVRHASPTPNAVYWQQTPQQRYAEQYHVNVQYPPANYQNVQYVYPPQKQLAKYHKPRTPGPTQLQASQEAAFAARQQYLAYAQHYPHLYDPRMYHEWRKAYRNQQQYRQVQTPRGGAEAEPFNGTDSFSITPDPGAKKDESTREVAARHADRYERMKGLDPRLANGSSYKGSRKQMASRGSGADEVQYFKLRDQGAGYVKREVVSGEGQSSSELHPDDSAAEPSSEANQILPPDFREAFEETCKELLAMHVAFENVVDTPEEGSSKDKDIMMSQDVKPTQQSVLNPNLLTTRHSSFETTQAASAQGGSKLVTKQTTFVKGTKADRGYFSKTAYMRRSQDRKAKSVSVKDGPNQEEQGKVNRGSEESGSREPTKVMGWLTATR